MAVRIEITPAEIATNAPAIGPGGIGDKLRNNEINHHDRLNALEGSVATRMFDHFDRVESPIANPYVGAASGPRSDYWEINDQGGTPTHTILQTDHVLRSQCTAATDIARINMKLKLSPTLLPQVTLRMNMDDFDTLDAFAVGMLTIGGADADDDVILEVSGTTFRFRCRKDGVATSGSTFGNTITQDGNWFEVDIKYTDSDTVECRFDGGNLETFNGPGQNVPSAFGEHMFAGWLFSPSGAVTRNLDCDRALSVNTTIADAA